ncbi:PglL family O-oligosaccharyltransferase [Acinetobacter sp. Ver3]|uniref:PglL family O-oligosaccharyltransferase n=1 Tax=Acinetobacter sp. Ver3 TaxID=466088 RepID=UPI001D17AFE7|nr:O-antigen ligase family protein [Acinetobacter sp. Ver3]
MNYLLGDLAYLQKGSRPYANFAQPNNFSTFLFLSLFSCLYFYERKLIQSKYLFLIGLFIVFNIVLAQSRTALLVSGFIIFYFFLKKNNVVLRFSFKQLVIWNVIFISLLFLIPLITPFVGHITAQPDMVLRNTVERASSGDIRLDMWQQMIAAILHQPWWGYGWNQTGLAQYYITDTFQVSLWYKSAHNMILDLLVWNGLILGGFILLYFTAWLLWLNKGVKDIISIIATLMVCAILIHGMLEFPLHYAYFLLPAGFLLGIIQAQYTNLPSLKIDGRVFAVIAFITIVGALVTTRDYFLYKEQSVLASKAEALTADQQHTMQKKIWLITQFKERVWWIGLDPKTEMTDQQLADLERMVANLASKYDLHKYAQVLAFNGKEQEAKHQLWILETLHKQHIEYDDLLK